ncbi:acyl-CoA dehydrogenase [Micromonospora sp. KC207]|uniref:acyl-CoA dehydrogenase family protein n=1 Tax=Micromonospora sp. KC207 TaxID=2530377 RepID=UPI00104FBFBD|nr:acyl-CoA dehydrogenase family protein [Micromonospora sp. KC207]TDC63755.1 acyl-CoA dehydrogenase [Micromonospora sp. KC207]
MTSVVTASDAVDPAPALDRAAARRFAREHVAPLAARFDQAGHIAQDTLDRIGAAGLWAPFLPVEYGGRGASMLTLGHIHEEVGRACSSVRSLLTVHGMVSWAVLRFGSPQQREHWLPRLATGAVLAAFCLSEPGAGSDAAGLTAQATRGPQGWVVDGHKKWITGGQRADLFLVFARTGSGIGAFLVPRGTPGVIVTPIDGMLGTRGSMLAEVRLDGAVAGPDALVGPDGFAAGMVMTGVLDLGRYSVAAGSVGILQACLDASARHAAQREVSSGRLRDLQLIQAKLSDMVTDTRAARLLYEEAGRLKDRGDAATLMATWVAKYFASVAAARHAAEAVQIHGALGCGPGHPVERLYRDAKVMEIIEGSNEIQRITIASDAYREAFHE